MNLNYSTVNQKKKHTTLLEKKIKNKNKNKTKTKISIEIFQLNI